MRRNNKAKINKGSDVKLDWAYPMSHLPVLKEHLGKLLPPFGNAMCTEYTMWNSKSLEITPL